MNAADIARKRESHLRLVRPLSIGGERWAVTRLAGDGFGAASAASAGTVAGYFHATRGGGAGTTLTDTPAAAATWQFTRTGGVALQVGDELQGDEVKVRIGPRTPLVITETWEATRR